MKWSISKFSVTCLLLFFAMPLVSIAAQIMVIQVRAIDADEQTVDGLDVTVTNETKNLTISGKTGDDGDGVFAPVFLNFSASVADAGDIIMVTIEEDGEVLNEATRTLSETEIDESKSLIVVQLVEFPAWDINQDGVINILDLVAVASEFGTAGQDLKGDVDGNGSVNIFDLVQVANHFGETTTSAAPSQRSLNAQQVNLKLSTPLKSVESRRIRTALTALERLGEKDTQAALASTLLRQWLVNLGEVPNQDALLPNFPNPFNPETWIPYQLSQPTDVRISIYNIVGQPVRQIDVGYQHAGKYISRSDAAYWDGRNNTGELVTSGLYFYTLETETYTETRKMIILK